MYEEVVGHIISGNTYCLKHSVLPTDEALSGRAKDYVLYQSEERCSKCNSRLVAVPFESNMLVYHQDTNFILGRTWRATHPVFKRVEVTIQYDFGGWWMAKVTANPYQMQQETWFVRLHDDLDVVVKDVDDFISSPLFQKVSAVEIWSGADGKHRLKE